MAAVSEALPHAIRVTRLYRQSLRAARSWCMTWQTYRDTCMSIRDRFDESKNEHNPVKVQRLVEECEEELKKYRHPIPYIFPSSPDGSKWERNVPPAAGVCRMKAHEYEWYYGVPPPKDYQCAPDHDAHH